LGAAGQTAPYFLFFPAKARGLGGWALTGYFFNAATPARFQGFDSKGEPDAADWKFAVVSAGGAQRRTLAALESLGF
jgi:hypothetical protein